MSELANSDLALRQVEYYMSDGNYPFDTYLQSLVREADGCVPLEKLVEFPRLKKLVDGDVAKLRDALGATDSLAFSDARDGVRRLHPTPDDDPYLEFQHAPNTAGESIHYTRVSLPKSPPRSDWSRRDQRRVRDWVRNGEASSTAAEPLRCAVVHEK